MPHIVDGLRVPLYHFRRGKTAARGRGRSSRRPSLRLKARRGILLLKASPTVQPAKLVVSPSTSSGQAKSNHTPALRVFVEQCFHFCRKIINTGHKDIKPHEMRLALLKQLKGLLA